MVTLVAIRTAIEGKGDALENEFKKLAPVVLKDPGVLIYAVHRSVDNPNRFLIFEQYENQEAFKAHGQTEHFKAFQKAVANLSVGPSVITFYNKVA